jgi:catechol 2,3-dioxygenase-like lactoylglutathione lyase family enzyme
MSLIASKLTRLHHMTYTSYDIAATRHFYEDLIGMPLTQTWVQNPTVGPLAGRVYVQCFFSLADGGALAYSQDLGVARPENRARSGFHIAFKCEAETIAAIRERLLADGYAPDDLRMRENEYCVSLYVTDPDGLTLEFAVDHDTIDDIVAWHAKWAHAELERWLSGDTTSNDGWQQAEG